MGLDHDYRLDSLKRLIGQMYDTLAVEHQAKPKRKTHRTVVILSCMDYLERPKIKQPKRKTRWDWLRQ